MSACRLGVWVSHPIQYLSPWFRHLAGRLDLEVFYAHRQDERGQAAAGFGVAFDWDVPLLEGYRHRWLRNVAKAPGVGSFGGCDTPEIRDVVRKFDAFLVFGWNRKGAIQTAWACWRHGVPVFMRGDSQLMTPRSLATSVVKWPPYRWLLPRASGHLYVGQRNREYLAHYGVPADRLFFAPHFVDNGYFSTRARDAQETGRTTEIRRQLGIPQSAFVFLFVGKMTAQKRPHDLLVAFTGLIDDAHGPDVHAVLVGDGPLRSSLEEMATAHRARIHFAGFRNQSELPAFYRASDALVLPSDGGETWGLVVNEALASGIPAIVSEAVGCAPDLIDPGRSGFTFPLGDVDALKARMLDLERVCRANGRAVRDAVAAKAGAYSLEAATAGLERAIETAVVPRWAERWGRAAG